MTSFITGAAGQGVIVAEASGRLWPLGRWGTDLYGELAVVEQARRAEQPTAGRDLISLYARSAARNGRKPSERSFSAVKRT